MLRGGLWRSGSWGRRPSLTRSRPQDPECRRPPTTEAGDDRSPRRPGVPPRQLPYNRARAASRILRRLRRAGRAHRRQLSQRRHPPPAAPAVDGAAALALSEVRRGDPRAGQFPGAQLAAAPRPLPRLPRADLPALSADRAPDRRFLRRRLLRFGATRARPAPRSSAPRWWLSRRSTSSTFCCPTG